jgi:hypothetical protein
MTPKWLSRYEFKQHKWIFVPTPESVVEGTKIKSELTKRWSIPSFYFHLRNGGHVGALREHLDNKYFLRVDIQNFFSSISRGRVTRCLKPLVGYLNAREFAHLSTVRSPINHSTIIPFGFIQSQIIASICLQGSALGVYLEKLHRDPSITVTVYVDDLIISAKDEDLLQSVWIELLEKATKSQFTFNQSKSHAPAEEISAFNIILRNGSLKIDDRRLDLFRHEIAGGSPEKIAGISSYIRSVNPDQL